MTTPGPGEGEMMREATQTLPTGTKLHFNGCPLTLADDCRVICATSLSKWQGETIGRDHKEPEE